MSIVSLDVTKPAPFPLPPREQIRELFPFAEMRPYQDLVLQRLIGGYDAGHRIIMLEAPTGFGKSALAVALARWAENSGRKAFVVVSSKFLQDQYLRDFKTVSVKGRGNFHCIKSHGHTCDTGARLGAKCTAIPMTSSSTSKKTLVGTSDKRGKLYVDQNQAPCPYWVQKCEALAHPYPLFNYDYFFSETRFVGDFGKRELLVCDEAHNIENKLMRFLGMDISSHELEQIGGRVPADDLTAAEWRTILGEWRERYQEKIRKAEEKLHTLTPPELDKLDDYRAKEQKCDFLMGELDMDPDTWVVFTQLQQGRYGPERTVSFKPIEIQKWGEYITGLGEKLLLQSATIMNPQTLATSLGITDALYLKVPSLFPVESRTFNVVPVGKMSRMYIDESMPRLMVKIQEIMNMHDKEKGIIHTHTYQIQNAVSKQVANPRILTHQAPERDRIFREFKAAKSPVVLVTPSAFEGVDFPGDECRWQILCKVPYPSLGDPQIRKRMERDQEWYNWQTALRIVQTYGRGMRSADDYCKTYILDADFKGFYFRNKHLFPDWFQAAVR